MSGQNSTSAMRQHVRQRMAEEEEALRRHSQAIMRLKLVEKDISRIEECMGRYSIRKFPKAYVMATCSDLQEGLRTWFKLSSTIPGLDMSYFYNMLTYTGVPQHHGDHVLVVTEKETGSGITKPYPDGAEAYGYDAMITDVPGTVLCTLHADCVPVLLYDPQNNAVGAVHSGWRGTVLKIAAKTVEKMECVYGTLPSELRAVIGPSIGMDCFETDDDVYEALQESFGLFPEGGDLFYRKGKKYHISVSGFVYRTLLEAPRM